jgi:hypothetical protein
VEPLARSTRVNGVNVCAGRAPASYSCCVFRASDAERLLCVPAIEVVCQRGKQVQPLRPAVTALACRAAQPGHHQSHGFAPATAAGRGDGWRGARVLIDPVARYPPWPCHIITLLAGRACQPADRVRTPARHQRPSPVVRFAQRRRVREPRGAARHVTPGSRYPDLVTDDAVFGNSNRMKQRIMAPWRPWRLSFRSRAHQSQCHHPACPAPHSLRYGMPGHGPCAQPALPLVLAARSAPAKTSPGGGEPHRDSRSGTRAHPFLQNAGPPLPVTAPAGYEPAAGHWILGPWARPAWSNEAAVPGASHGRETTATRRRP